VTLPSEPGTIPIADQPCNEVRQLRDRVEAAIAAERKAHPHVVYRVYDSPRTIPKIVLATAADRQVAFVQRLGISVAGVLLIALGTWIGNRIWKWAFGAARDPVWVR
jgi:hypothetical protein